MLGENGRTRGGAFEGEQISGFGLPAHEPVGKFGRLISLADRNDGACRLSQNGIDFVEIFPIAARREINPLLDEMILHLKEFGRMAASERVKSKAQSSEKGIVKFPGWISRPRTHNLSLAVQAERAAYVFISGKR